MTTTATDRPAGRHEAPTAPPAYHQSLPQVLRGEWIKARTLRSTWTGFVVVLLVLVGIGVIVAYVSTGSTPRGDARESGPLSVVLLGANFALLLLAVLGCLGGAREYGSGMITATVAAVPRRWQIIVGKSATLTAMVLPVALLGVFGAFFAGMAMLSSRGGATLALTDTGVLRSLIGTAAYLAAIALLGLALGVLLRSTAASIGILIGGVIILPGIAGELLPTSWQVILKYLPTNAGSSFTSLTPPVGNLGAAAGAAVLTCWVVAVLAAATVAISRRDV